MRKGYTILPEDCPEFLNDSYLKYSLTMNSIESTDKPSIASPLFIIDNSVVEILTGSIPVESALLSTRQEALPSGIFKAAQESDEVEYEIKVDFEKSKETYEMIGIEKEQSEIARIDSIGQYMYEITTESSKYTAKCATVDENIYIVLSDTGDIYSVDRSCIVRKQNDRRLEE